MSHDRKMWHVSTGPKVYRVGKVITIVPQHPPASDDILAMPDST